VARLIEARRAVPPVPLPVLAAELGRSEWSVRQKVVALGLTVATAPDWSDPRPKAGAVAPRRCLACGRMFKRNSPWLFLCPTHRHGGASDQ
jgi:hypothetical protein